MGGGTRGKNGVLFLGVVAPWDKNGVGNVCKKNRGETGTEKNWRRKCVKYSDGPLGVGRQREPLSRGDLPRTKSCHLKTSVGLGPLNPPTHPVTTSEGTFSKQSKTSGSHRPLVTGKLHGDKPNNFSWAGPPDDLPWEGVKTSPGGEGVTEILCRLAVEV